jgi:hypothetical protein
LAAANPNIESTEPLLSWEATPKQHKATDDWFWCRRSDGLLAFILESKVGCTVRMVAYSWRLIVLVIGLEGLQCQAFHVPNKGRSSNLDSRLQTSSNGMDGYEAAREAFETSFRDSSSRSSLSSSFAKPLTANSKRIMELELKLLAQLADSDDVVDPLVDLWVGERADASHILRDMEEIGTCSPGLQREEGLLRDMVERYGLEWVEPMSRLALLLFTKGRNAEAIELTRKVLEIKPWHFEAGQLMVVMLLREEYYAEALKVARSYCLPSLNEHTNNRRRKAWVQEMTRRAQEILRQARMVTVYATQADSSLEDLCNLDVDFCWQ